MPTQYAPTFELIRKRPQAFEQALRILLGQSFDDRGERWRARESSSHVTFTEWNGDRLAELIERYFLREDLLPDDARPMLRKALAMLDEPASSYAYFCSLIRSLSTVDSASDEVRTRAIRQMCICLWVLYAWGRDNGNLESPYRSSEFALLHAWYIVSFYSGKKNKAAQAVEEAFLSILSTYQTISSEYLATRIMPHVNKRDGLSSAVRSGCDLDVNLKLFDVLGRIAMKGIWGVWLSQAHAEGNEKAADPYAKVIAECASAISSLVSHNPVLLLPRKDDQAIDIWLAVSLLAMIGSLGDIRAWLTEMFKRAEFAYRTHGLYPCNLNSYRDLLEHPKKNDDEYRESVTSGSLLYPMVSFWAALLNFDHLYSDVAHFKENDVPHCNFQFWYPDETSEKHFYKNTDAHGAALSQVPVDRPAAEFLELVFSECEHSRDYGDLSAVHAGIWPIILVACRHYRLPLPLHLFQDLRDQAN